MTQSDGLPAPPALAARTVCRAFGRVTWAGTKSIRVFESYSWMADHYRGELPMTSTAAVKANGRKARPRGALRSAGRTPWAFLAPAVIVLFLITIVPFIVEIVLSLLSVELTVPGAPTWLGLKNYATALFADDRFWNALKVTFTIIIAGVGTELLLGIGLALLLNRLRRSRGVLTSLFLIPVMVAPVVSGMMWLMIYDDKFGPLNYVIQILTFGHVHGAAWLGSPDLALFSVILADIWQWTPFIIMIVLAGLQSVPPELYEAAEVDGAGRWSSLWHITLPLLMPVLVIGVLIRFMDSFKLFDLISLITRGGPGISTETISFYTYVRGFQQFSIGYTAAMAFLQLIVITVVAKMFIGFLNRQRGEAK
jgi:multiple sugar transport system permease protein